VASSIAEFQCKCPRAFGGFFVGIRGQFPFDRVGPNDEFVAGPTTVRVMASEKSELLRPESVIAAIVVRLRR